MIKEGYTRISTILGAFSGLDKIDPDVLKNAADRGTVTHKAIDLLLEGKDEWDLALYTSLGVKSYAKSPEHQAKESDLVTNMFSSFAKWGEKKTFRPKIERLYDDELMITGEIDQLYEEDGKLVLVDFKTSYSESKTWAIQGAAYAKMLALMGLNVDRIEFIKLSRIGGMPIVYTYDYQPELLKSIVETYKYFYENRKFEMDIDYL